MPYLTARTAIRRDLNIGGSVGEIVRGSAAVILTAVLMLCCCILPMGKSARRTNGIRPA